MSKLRILTEEEENFILEHYLKLPVKTLARQIKSNHTWLMAYLKRNNLVIPKEIIEQRKINSQFKKGHTIHNKGKKLTEYASPESIEKIKLTQFKKGQIPKNSLPEGSQVIRQDKSGKVYVMIKVKGERKLKYKHIHIYEQNFGKVPKGYCVIFKDRNEMNFDPSNLIAISRGALMLWNSRRVDIPIELIESHAKVATLKKLIKTKLK